MRNLLKRVFAWFKKSPAVVVEEPDYSYDLRCWHFEDVAMKLACGMVCFGSDAHAEAQIWAGFVNIDDVPVDRQAFALNQRSAAGVDLTRYEPEEVLIDDWDCLCMDETAEIYWLNQDSVLEDPSLGWRPEQLALAQSFNAQLRLYAGTVRWYLNEYGQFYSFRSDLVRSILVEEFSDRLWALGFASDADLMVRPTA